MRDFLGKVYYKLDCFLGYADRPLILGYKSGGNRLWGRLPLPAHSPGPQRSPIGTRLPPTRFPHLRPRGTLLQPRGLHTLLKEHTDTLSEIAQPEPRIQSQQVSYLGHHLCQPW